jgi:uncharacterized membrane protein
MLLGRFAGTRLLFPCIAASALAVTMLLGRRWFGAGGYHFLVWNLFLAWLPYLASLWLAWQGQRGRLRLFTTLPVLLLWLLFLPNAPYLLTDLVHLWGMDFVWWYDIGTLVSFAWAGCLIGVASLDIMAGLATERSGPQAGWLVVLIVAALSGLGVYMGRFLRWNSWDALLRPQTLLVELLHILGDPGSYPRLLGMSGLIAALMLLGYLTLVSVQGGRKRELEAWGD